MVSIDSTLARDFTILLLDPERGRYPAHRHPDLLYTSATLLDLLGRGGIRIRGEGRAAGIELAGTHAGDEILDGYLDARAMGITPGRLDRAVRWGACSMIVMVRALAAAGEVRIERTTRLGVFTRTRYYPLPAAGRAELRTRLHDAVRGERALDRQTALLAALRYTTGRGLYWVAKDERAGVSKRLRDFLRGDQVTDADRAVLESARAAITRHHGSGG